MKLRTRSSTAGRVPRLGLIFWAHLSLRGRPGVQNADSRALKALHIPCDPFDHVY